MAGLGGSALDKSHTSPDDGRKMTTLLIEPFAGMAGDMFLAALLDLGDPRRPGHLGQQRVGVLGDVLVPVELLKHVLALLPGVRHFPMERVAGQLVEFLKRLGHAV